VILLNFNYRTIGNKQDVIVLISSMR